MNIGDVIREHGRVVRAADRTLAVSAVLAALVFAALVFL